MLIILIESRVEKLGGSPDILFLVTWLKTMCIQLLYNLYLRADI